MEKLLKELSTYVDEGYISDGEKTELLAPMKSARSHIETRLDLADANNLLDDLDAQFTDVTLTAANLKLQIIEMDRRHQEAVDKYNTTLRNLERARVTTKEMILAIADRLNDVANQPVEQISEDISESSEYVLEEPGAGPFGWIGIPVRKRSKRC